MVIDKPFDGIYYGENVEKELKQYLESLAAYVEDDPEVPDGQYYRPETQIRHRVEVPEGFEISRHSDEFKELPIEKKKEIDAFWAEQAHRMEYGHEGMCGLQYGYFNFAKQRGGRTPGGVTSYRRADNALFSLIQSCIVGADPKYDGVGYGDNRGRGVLELGRRRSGKTAKLGWFCLETTRMKQDIDVIVTSKTEDDAQRIIIQDKIKFMYDKSPEYIKADQYKTSKGELWFGRSEKDGGGNLKIAGQNSKILGKTPKPEALEGSTLMVWIHDEGPKTMNLKRLVEYTIPALSDEEGYELFGFPYITGVAGDFDKFGQDFIEIWESAKEWKFIRWFSPGWYSQKVNELGNEDVEAAVRQILEDRHEVMSNKKLTGGQKEAKIREMMQKYPLTPQEAIMASAEGLWNGKVLFECKERLEKAYDVIHITEGEMSWDIPGVRPKFSPTMDGKVKILEPPQKNSKYVIGGDAYGFSQKGYGGQGASWVFKLKENLSPMEESRLLDAIEVARYTENGEDVKRVMELHLKLGNLPVACYVDAPQDPNVYADRLYMLAKWYEIESRSSRPVRILIETEPSNILNRLVDKYLKNTMAEPLKKVTGKRLVKNPTFGLPSKGSYWIEARLGETGHYIENFCSRIYFKELVSKMQTYSFEDKNKKYDIVDGFQITLCASKSAEIEAWLKEGLETEAMNREPAKIMNFKREKRTDGVGMFM